MPAIVDMPDSRFKPDAPFSDSDIGEIESVLGRASTRQRIWPKVA
jgi:hypothetical protein